MHKDLMKSRLISCHDWSKLVMTKDLFPTLRMNSSSGLWNVSLYIYSTFYLLKRENSPICIPPINQPCLPFCITFLLISLGNLNTFVQRGNEDNTNAKCWGQTRYIKGHIQMVSEFTFQIRHFRVAPSLCFKARLTRSHWYVKHFVFLFSCK